MLLTELKEVLFCLLICLLQVSQSSAENEDEGGNFRRKEEI